MAINATKAIAHQSVAVSSTAKALTDLGFTQAQIDRSSRARITADTNPLRMTYDGTTPTASIGHYLPVGAGTEVVGDANIANLKFIRAGASDGAVSVTLEE